MTTRFVCVLHPRFLAALNTFVENADSDSLAVRRAALLRHTKPHHRERLTALDLSRMRLLASFAGYNGPMVVIESV